MVGVEVTSIENAQRHRSTSPTSAGGMQRVCFQLQVKPERIGEYKSRHAAVWPELLAALRDTGWHNYSLFLRPDGLLIGYFETPSLDAARSGMAATDVNARWQSEMAEFFEDLGDERPDTGFVQLAEVFHLEDQLADAEHLHGTEPEDGRTDA